MKSTKTNNPWEFWSNLSNLGPTKRNSIPREYCETQGNVTHEQENILQVWKNDFELLYNPVYEDSKFYNDFLSSILEYNDGEVNSVTVPHEVGEVNSVRVNP